MKSISMYAVAVLAVCLIAPAAVAQTGTSLTAAASGTYPAGSTYNGTPLEAIHVSAGVDMEPELVTGRLNARLVSPEVLGVRTVIIVEGLAASGTRVDATTATVSGSASVETGGVRVDGVPFVATIATNAEGHGAVTLVLGTTALPAATINEGSMTIKDVDLE